MERLDVKFIKDRKHNVVLDNVIYSDDEVYSLIDYLKINQDYRSRYYGL